VCVCVCVCVCVRARATVSEERRTRGLFPPFLFPSHAKTASSEEVDSISKQHRGVGEGMGGGGQVEELWRAHKVSTQPPMKCVQAMRRRKHLRAHPPEKQVHESTCNVGGSSRGNQKGRSKLVKRCRLTKGLHHTH
jgi:hypothetical protein